MGRVSTCATPFSFFEFFLHLEQTFRADSAWLDVAGDENGHFYAVNYS